MNTRPPIETTPTPSVLSVSFNNDASCFSVGLDTGICKAVGMSDWLKVFHTKSCLLKASRDFNAGIGLVQMMGKTNYLAMVGGGRNPKFSQNKAIIWDDLKGKVALEITTLTAVRGVQLAREHIIIALQNSIRVYRFAKPPELLSVYETADNLLGLCAKSEKMIAFPGRTTGHLQLVDLASGNVSIIPAHSSALRAISLSLNGELLATASETGTLLRVYSTSNCARVAELRRGIDPATIFSLAFNPSGNLLAATSDKSTLHVFDVSSARHSRSSSSRSPHPSGSSSLSSAQENDGKWGLLGKIPLMPRVFSDTYSIASAPFEAGEDFLVGGLPLADTTTLGTSRPAKGLTGWLSDDSLVIIGAGTDARWEKFVIQFEDGKRYCVREGWKRYLGHV